MAMFLACSTNSCTDEETSFKDKVTKKENINLISNQKNVEYVNLTDEQISNIGHLHNEILSNFVLTLPNSDVNNFFMNYQISDLSADIKEIMIQNSNVQDLVYLEENLKDPEAINIINSVLNEEFESLDHISNTISDKKVYAKQVLTKLDLDVVLVFLKVYESSAVFWENNSQYTNSPSAKITTKGLIGADGTGAAVGIMRFIMVAAPIAAAGGPIGVGMLVSSVGWSAAMASASYLVHNYH